mgnify:CR=1 FL=1
MAGFMDILGTMMQQGMGQSGGTRMKHALGGRGGLEDLLGGQRARLELAIRHGGAGRRHDECRAIVEGLDAIQAEIEQGDFEWSVDLEDVHMNIEARLTERIGEAGKRLHTARSRNDQVLTALRLYLRDAALDLSGRVEHLRSAIENDEIVVMYQPKLDLRTGVVVGAERVAGVQHAAGGGVDVECPKHPRGLAQVDTVERLQGPAGPGRHRARRCSSATGRRCPA